MGVQYILFWVRANQAKNISLILFLEKSN